MPTPSTATHMNTGACTDEWKVRGVYTGAGAAVPVKVRGKGITTPGLTRQGVGLYTLALQDVGGSLLGFFGETHTAATVSPQTWKYVVGSLTKNALGLGGSIQIECWNEVAPALADPPAGSFVELEITFATNVVD